MRPRRGPMLLIRLAGAALLAAGALAYAFAQPPRASAASTTATIPVRFGIGDQHTAMFGDPRWQALGLRITRLNVPWDAARDPDQLARAVDYVAAAREHGVDTLVHLTGRAPDGVVERLPSRAAYRSAVRALVARLRPLGVHTWGTWNEANHATQPTSHHPERAAQFFLELRAACAGCTIVAADVLTQGSPRSTGVASYRGWLGRFYRALGSKRSLARIVGIHNYGELIDAGGAGISRDLTRFVRRSARSARFWITESGGIAANRSRSCSEARQATGTRRMFSHASALAKDGIDRLYAYNWTAADCTDLHDSGLIRSDGTARPALAVVEQQAPRFRR
ncbi:MAG: hypothetical protein PGN13_10635 [Patulibacter minatonensis]